MYVKSINVLYIYSKEISNSEETGQEIQIRNKVAKTKQKLSQFSLFPPVNSLHIIKTFFVLATRFIYKKVMF